MDTTAQELPNLLQGQLDGLNTFFETAKGETYDSDWGFHAMFLETSMKAFTIGTSAVAGVEALAQGPEYNTLMQIANDRLSVLNEAVSRIGPPLASISEYEEAWAALYWATSDCIAALRTAVSSAIMMLEEESAAPGPLTAALSKIFLSTEQAVLSVWDKFDYEKIAERMANAAVDQVILRSEEVVSAYMKEVEKQIQDLKDQLLSQVESRAKEGAVGGVMPLLIGAGILALIMMRKR